MSRRATRLATTRTQVAARRRLDTDAERDALDGPVAGVAPGVPLVSVAPRVPGDAGAAETLAGELGLAAAVVAFHVADHRLVHERFHLFTHLGAGIAVTFAAAALGADQDDLGLAPDRFLPAARAGLLHSIVPVAGLAVAAFVPALEPALADPRATHETRGDLAFRLALDIPLGTAVYEELVFRSAFLGLTARRFSTPVAVGLSSALFGLWHVLPALEDRRHNPVVQRYPLAATVAPTVVSTALAGTWFAVLRVRTGHVAAPVVAHAAINTAGLLAATIVHLRRRRRARTGLADGEVPQIGAVTTGAQAPGAGTDSTSGAG